MTRKTSCISQSISCFNNHIRHLYAISYLISKINNLGTCSNRFCSSTYDRNNTQYSETCTNPSFFFGELPALYTRNPCESFTFYSYRKIISWYESETNITQLLSSTFYSLFCKSIICCMSCSNYHQCTKNSSSHF